MQTFKTTWVNKPTLYITHYLGKEISTELIIIDLILVIM